jgi:phage gp29-like protein
VLGQTLTTDIGSAGSYAAAKAHNLVREDLAAADRRRISACFNRLAAVWTFYNFGTDVAPPSFEFVKDEDLQTDRAERDVKLYALGWRPKKSYITREYEIPEEDFDIKSDAGAFKKLTVPPTFSCGCGAASSGDDKQSALQKFAALFASKEDKQHEKDNARDTRLMREFAKIMLREGQENINGQIENYADALGNVTDFDDAREALLSSYGKNSFEDFAHTLDEVRFAAQGIGGRHA